MRKLIFPSGSVSPTIDYSNLAEPAQRGGSAHGGKIFVKQYKALALAAAVFGSLTGAGSAAAQSEAVAVSGAQTVAASSAQVMAGSTSSGAMLDDTGGELDATPMNGFGIGLKLGVAGMGAGELQLDAMGEDVMGRVGTRRGMYVSLPIHVGGDGFGWVFEPFLAKASLSHQVTDSSGFVSGNSDSDLMAYGMYTGPSVNIQVVRPLYLGIGAGIKLAYVTSPSFEYAGDAYGRVPLSATYYLANQVALVAELGLGYGVSAYLNKPQPVVDSVTRTVENEGGDIQFGKALAWDCSIGVRLP